MRIFYKWIIVLFVLSSSTCSSKLFSELEGEWKNVDEVEGETPNFILFHKSGRYIVFNDLESPYPWMSVVEKGNWVAEHDKVKLFNREFVVRGASFQKYHEGEAELLMPIRHISKKELVLEVGRDKKKYIERYKKVKLHAKMMQRYTTFGDNPVILALPSSATILKLRYKFNFYNHNSEEVKLIVEDQNGNQLWHKTITMSTKGVEEILLADKPGVESFTHVKFKVAYTNYATSPSWDIKATIY